MESDFQDIATLLQDLRIFQFLEAASLTILLYDYVLSFSDELRYIWRAKWNPGKWLYLAIRYIATIEITVTTVNSLAPGARSQSL